MVHDLKTNPIGETTIPPEPGKPAPSIDARQSLWRTLANRIWGYDFFLSYNWASGGSYAVSLAERLRDRGFDCFLDQSEFAAGDDWRNEAAHALGNTGRLVVIATHKAIADSEAVRHEIELFTRRSDRVIPIVFGRRFSEAEQRQYPTLQRIPDSTIDLVEDEARLNQGPSETILKQLIQAHRLVRRRAMRAGMVTGALAALAIFLAVALVFWALAASARDAERTQKLLAQSAELVNKADLLRETEGPKLETSLRNAETAYRNSRLANEPSDQALQAYRQARVLMPEPIGSPWMPFGTPVSVRLRATGRRLVVYHQDSPKDGDPFALVVELDGETKQWRVVRNFTTGEHGKIATNRYGPIDAMASPRWLLTQKSGQVTIWNVSGPATDPPHARMACGQPVGSDGSIEMVAIDRDAGHALVRCGDQLTVRGLGASPSPPVKLPPDAPRFARYAISPSGKKIAWARQNEFAVVSTGDWRQTLNYPITAGGGHPHSVQFIGPGHQEDQAVFVSWSANQVQARPTGARRDAPSNQAGIWALAGPDALNQDTMVTPPDITLVRANPFNIVFSDSASEPSLAVVDPENPVQWLDLESQISFTLGAAAGPGTRARFDGKAILIVHADGTARLWNLDSRRELLRFTAKAGEVVDDAVFLTVRTGNAQTRAVVTVDGSGVLQAWTSKRNPARVEDALKRLEKADTP
jgi:TIR domain